MKIKLELKTWISHFISLRKKIFVSLILTVIPYDALEKGSLSNIASCRYLEVYILLMQNLWIFTNTMWFQLKYLGWPVLQLHFHGRGGRFFSDWWEYERRHKIKSNEKKWILQSSKNKLSFLVIFDTFNHNIFAFALTSHRANCIRWWPDEGNIIFRTERAKCQVFT